MVKATCKADDCQREVLAKGLCQRHYARAHKRGDGTYDLRKRSLYGGTTLDRYEAAVDRSGGPDACHPWIGYTYRGYGMFFDGGRTASGTLRPVRAHRWGYINTVGPIPPGLVVRHTCHNKACQNKRHWLLGTNAQNIQDSIDAGMVVCERKLDWDKVDSIRKQHEAGGISRRELAAEWGITEVHLDSIIKFKVWTIRPHSETAV